MAEAGGVAPREALTPKDLLLIERRAREAGNHDDVRRLLEEIASLRELQAGRERRLDEAPARSAALAPGDAQYAVELEIRA